MARILHIVMVASYGLGLASITLAFAARFIPAIGRTMEVSSRGGLIFAATLFLCSVASHYVEGAVAARN